MDARDIIKVGMSAERILVVPPERAVGHFVPHMPMVYATPMMILEMEMTAGDAINKYLKPGWVTVAASSTPGSVGWERSPIVRIPMSTRSSYDRYSTASRRKM